MFYQEENCSILTKSAVEYKLLSMWHNIPKKNLKSYSNYLQIKLINNLKSFIAALY